MITLRPPLESFLAYQGESTHVALSAEILVDRETPISLYQKLNQDRSESFLLESVEGGETLGRYSFIGTRAVASLAFSNGKGKVLRKNEKVENFENLDPLALVEKMLASYRVLPQEGLPRFQGGAVGYLGFDCVRYFEKVPLPEKMGLDIPEALFLLVDELVIFDHLKHKVILVVHLPLEGNREENYRQGQERIAELFEKIDAPLSRESLFSPFETVSLPSFRANLEKEVFEKAVLEAKEAIAEGEVFQVVLSQRFTIEEEVDSFELYRTLRALNPSPYLFYLRFDGWAVVGASPEVLVRLEGEEILLRPIAGTRPRGGDRLEDEKNELELLADEKELAEHRMLLDLGRNDVGRMASIATVQVEKPLHIERYSHVMHLVSDVRGKIKPEKNSFDLLRACFPAGTVSGAPKIRAMELIGKLEPDRRALYAGAVGYFDFTGNMDTCIAIRTMVVFPKEVHLQVGAGIVFDSDPSKEYQECLNKAKGGLAALGMTLEKRKNK